MSSRLEEVVAKVMASEKLTKLKKYITFHKVSTFLKMFKIMKIVSQKSSLFLFYVEMVDPLE